MEESLNLCDHHFSSSNVNGSCCYYWETGTQRGHSSNSQHHLFHPFSCSAESSSSYFRKPSENSFYSQAPTPCRLLCPPWLWMRWTCSRPRLTLPGVLGPIPAHSLQEACRSCRLVLGTTASLLPPARPRWPALTLPGIQQQLWSQGKAGASPHQPQTAH